MKQFFCELLFICTAAAPGAQPLDELTYGTVLYEFYQEEYDQALLQTLVAYEQQRTGEDMVRFDLAKGSFAFAGGMYAYANETFNAVPEGELTDLDQMRLAFHLSREFHRRGDWPSLSEQIAKIELGKSWLGKRRVHPEVEFMRAELAVVEGRYDEAARLFQEMEVQNPLRAYGLFNLGVAYRHADQTEQALQTFRQLADMPAYSEEAYDLSQRARLAMALLARQQQNTTHAEQVLSDLPGDGRYQDVAMAAYGGLAMDNADYQLAARIWMTLKEQDYWTPSTATARLGFPLSLEKMAEQGSRASTELALMNYREAEQAFANRLASLTNLTQEAEEPAWVRELIQVFSEADVSTDDSSFMQKWQEQLGHTDWLEWLAEDDIHQALQQWRELNDMNGWLGDMPTRIAALQEVSQEVQRRNSTAEDLLVNQGLLAKQAELAAQIEATELAIEELNRQPMTRTMAWMYPLATAEERALLDDLETKRGLLVHMSEQDQIKWGGRIDRLQGVVFFQIVESYASRIYELKKQNRELAGLLDDITASVARVQIADENFIGGVGTDFMIFNDRATQLVARVDQAAQAREAYLAGQIKSRMQDEMRRVEEYLLVTRIAIARATDQLALAGDQP